MLLEFEGLNSNCGAGVGSFLLNALFIDDAADDKLEDAFDKSDCFGCTGACCCCVGATAGCAGATGGCVGCDVGGLVGVDAGCASGCVAGATGGCT